MPELRELIISCPGAFDAPLGRVVTWELPSLEIIVGEWIPRCLRIELIAPNIKTLILNTSNILSWDNEMVNSHKADIRQNGHDWLYDFVVFNTELREGWTFFNDLQADLKRVDADFAVENQYFQFDTSSSGESQLWPSTHTVKAFYRFLAARQTQLETRYTPEILRALAIADLEDAYHITRSSMWEECLSSGEVGHVPWCIRRLPLGLPDKGEPGLLSRERTKRSEQAECGLEDWKVSLLSKRVTSEGIIVVNDRLRKVWKVEEGPRSPFSPPTAWPEDSQVILCLTAETECTFGNFLDHFRNTRISWIIYFDGFVSSADIFQYYIACYILSKEDQRVRLTLRIVAFFPRIWRELLLELASGVYKKETLASLWEHLTGTKCDDEERMINTFTDSHTLQQVVEVDSRVARQGVGPRCSSNYDFQDWYRQMVQVTLPPPPIILSLFMPRDPYIGEVKSSCSWLLSRILQGDFSTLKGWNIPVVLPLWIPPSELSRIVERGAVDE